MKLKFWSNDPDEQPDAQVGAWLGELDPGRDDASYWMGFHRTAVDLNRLELRRRRRENERSVTGVMSYWGRAVVPAALTAAAVAGFFLARPFFDTPIQVGLEDMVSMGVGAPIPSDLDADDDEGWIVLTSERY